MRTFCLYLYPFLIFILLMQMTQTVCGQIHAVLPRAADPAFTKNPVAQNCASDALLNELRKKPGFKTREANMNRQILSVSGTLGTDSFILPVVFHIITPDPSLITDAQVFAALKNLNDAFGKKGAYAASLGADTRIQFCLARTDPDGGSSTGITRTVSTFIGSNLNAFIEDDKLKNLNRWDPSRYINIWIISSTNFEGVTNFVCGNWLRLSESAYATFPGTGALTDGIVLSGITPGPGQAHEMGHYLGLYHTFEGLDCNNNDCETSGDHVCDTPPDASVGNSPSCTSPQNSCSSDTLSNHSNGAFPVDVPDQIANFMDYSNDACHNEFTEGQAERMRAAITTQRSGLLQNECDKPCPENSVAGFTRDLAQPLPGNLIQFTNESTGATQYEWLVNGVSVSTNPDYSVSFPAKGMYKVTLKAFNGDATCFASYSDFVLVTCGVTASFYADKKTIASKFPIYLDSILFTNNSTNANNYQWLLSFNGAPEQVVSTDLNDTYVFPNPGNYTMRLIATNGSCSDTTEYYSIPVADPTQDGILYFNDVQCYQETKIRVAVQFCNSGYATIPANMPVTFYDSDPRNGNAKKIGNTFFFPQAVPGNCCSNSFASILDVNAPGLNQLWAVLNDSGTTNPFSLPATSLKEVSYLNNFNSSSGFQFRITAVPPSTVLQPGDTLQLSEFVYPSYSGISSFVWSSAQDLNCTLCATPFYVAGKTIDTVTKQLIATSAYGCKDTSYLEIKIPPYDDYTITLDSVACAGKDSLHAVLTICNHFSRGTIPKGLKVSFYDNDPAMAGTNILGPLFSVPADNPATCASYALVLKRTVTGKLYAVVNDSGTTIPLILPNDNNFAESVYTNNKTSINYIPFTVSIEPPNATLEPGDTLGLKARAGPEYAVSYQWMTAQDISCTNCDSTVFIAGKKDITKTVIVTNSYGCSDTTSILIRIPPADDYTMTLGRMICSRNDSLLVDFTVCNQFKRGIIPAGLQVSFYDADPFLSGANILGPVFTIPADVLAGCASYTILIRAISAGSVYGVVNNNGNQIPIVFPDDTLYLEKTYSNNTTLFAYRPDTVSLQPSDTTIFRKQSIPVLINTTIYDPSSTTWFPGNGYTLSCTSCPSPMVTVTDNSTVTMRTANQYGCLISGKMKINIFPPDMVIQLLTSNCFTNNSTRVRFLICMNNGYDSIVKNIPVSFYEGNPQTGGAHLLQRTFYTPAAFPVSCDTFIQVISTPVSGNLYAVVNDKGGNSSGNPEKAFDETDYSNNTSNLMISPFVASVVPADTTIFRNSSVQIMADVSGGQLSNYRWDPSLFLSCTNCLTPVATPPYSMNYAFVAQNEFGCVDTVYASLKTFAGGNVDIPNAFSPNGDGHNDIFYILGSRDIQSVKDFSIYNRLGEKMFEVSNVPSNDPRYGWNGLYNGKRAAADTYVYFAKIQFTNGKEQLFKGTVILVR